jgi:PAS domain S-box-containing protein
MLIEEAVVQEEIPMISVLYVDDEGGLLELGKLFLEKSGQFRVDTVTSAQEALEILKSTSYDAIVSDYQMPDMDGIALLKEIRAGFPDLPFIIFTGKGREEVAIEAFDNGADFYLQKGGTPTPQFLELGHKIIAAVRRKQAEKALQDSEMRYRNVVEDQTEFISRFLPNGTHVFVNEAYCRYFNKSRDEIIGKKFKPDIPQEDKNLVRDHFLSLTKENPIASIDHRIIMPDGEIRWQRWSDRAIFNDGGALIEYQSVGRDITETKRTEEDLRLKNVELQAAYEQIAATEEDLRSSYDDLAKSQRSLEDKETTLNAILQESPIPQFVIDRDHKILYWNHALAAQSGILAHDVIGTDQQWRAFYPSQRLCLADLLVDESMDTIPEWYADKYAKFALIDNAYEVTDFFPQIGKEGKWLHFKAGLIKNRNGDIIGAVESLEDITDRKSAELDLMKKNDELHAAYEQLTAAEEELRSSYDDLVKSQHALQESEARYRNVVEDQTEFICRFLPDGTHVFVNDAYCRYFGKSREEIIGHIFIPDIPGEDRENVKLHFASLTPSHPVDSIEHRIIIPGGEICWQRWNDRAIFDEKGNITEFQSVGRDITDRRQAEDALLQANRRLNMMTSITRHDINNQITMLTGFLRFLEKKQPDPTLGEYYQKISTTANQISAMIRFTKEYEKIGIHAPVWQDTQTLVDTAAKEVPLGNVRVKNDIPAGTEVFADPLIVKVFYNLMDNAARYGEKISIIRFSVQESGENFLIVCEDDGEGIPAKEKEKIFDRGFGKNTGLGLFFAREILSITGITIRETGEPGKGARFEITLPKGVYRFTDVVPTLDSDTMT